MLVPINKIIVDERQRKQYDDVDKLASSIATYGQLQPILLTRDMHLVAGGRRLEAHRQLAREEIKAEFVDDPTIVLRKEMELEENLQRLNLTWQEHCLAVAEIHDLRSKDAALNSEKWGFEQTGALLGRAKSNVFYAVFVAQYLRSGDEEIMKSNGMMDAYSILIKRKEKEAVTRLNAITTSEAMNTALNDKLAVKRYDKNGNTYTGDEPLDEDEEGKIYGWDIADKPVRTAPAKAATTTPSIDIELRLRSIIRPSTMTEIAPSCEYVDCIYTDPPYAINMDNIGQSGIGMNVDEVRETHKVEDNLLLLKEFLERSYLLLKDKGFCVFWYDVSIHNFLESTATDVGFIVQRWPLVWVKTSSCQNGAATYNFTKATEFAMVCRKPNTVLMSHAATNYWSGPGDKQEQGALHPFWKPIELHKWVLSKLVLPGSVVLDPFAGEGSIPQACLLAKLNPIAYECNPEIRQAMHTRLTKFI